MKKIKLIILWLTFLCSPLIKAAEISGDKIQPDNLFPQVKFETNVGSFVVELDRNKAPITSNNFLGYVASGQYDGSIFHRVVKDFVVQAGGYNALYQEIPQRSPIFNESGNGLKNALYTIAMARERAPHSATNQFYFNMADNDGLDPGKTWGYAVFGLVIEGEAVLSLINQSITEYNSTLGFAEVPTKNIVIKKVSVISAR